METQLHQQGEQRKRAEADLNAVRDLCVKLDQQKESLEGQLGDKEAMRAQVDFICLQLCPKFDCLLIFTISILCLVRISAGQIESGAEYGTRSNEQG